MKLEQVIREAKALTVNERAFLAHRLISSLEPQQDEGVDEVWMALAEQRIDEIEAGKVEPVSWHDIKSRLKAAA